nr:integrase arm-type DNA-binding domain-containing protein [Afipia massiliensis]
MNRLSPARVRALVKKPTPHRRYSDGGGLWLQISKSGTFSWLFQYTLGGRSRWHGLGPFPDVTLAEARILAGDKRKLVRDGIDPKAQTKADRVKGLTFKEVAEDYIKGQSAGWKNAAHSAQWPSTLKTYAYPVIGDLPVSTIDTDLVLKILRPIWNTKTETADRVRQRIERVLEAARVRGAFNGANPARWKDNLKNSDLAPRSKVAPVQHHKAIPFKEIPAFMRKLRQRNSTSARALEFTILTATRTGAVLGATWAEMDFKARLWTIPPDRAGVKISDNRPRVVPLSGRALEILKMFRNESDARSFVFAGKTPMMPMSNMAMLQLLRDMKPGFTVHGFRSSFKDWASESTDPVYENAISEIALFHVVKDKTEAAYRRGDLLERRRNMMAHWDRYCGSKRGA